MSVRSPVSECMNPPHQRRPVGCDKCNGFKCLCTFVCCILGNQQQQQQQQQQIRQPACAKIWKFGTVYGTGDGPSPPGFKGGRGYPAVGELGDAVGDRWNGHSLWVQLAALCPPDPYSSTARVFPSLRGVCFLGGFGFAPTHQRLHQRVGRHPDL